MRERASELSSAKIMKDFYLILFKTAVFIISYAIVSKKTLKFFKTRNLSAELWDVEIITVSVISAVIITSAIKYIFKLFI